MNCTRSDLVDITIPNKEVSWDSVRIDNKNVRYWMGRQLPRIHREAPQSKYYMLGYQYAIEEQDEGCPGGYIYSPFINSLLPYMRDQSEDGQRIENLKLSKCDNPLIIEAIAAFERYQAVKQNAAKSLIHEDQMKTMRTNAKNGNKGR